ncbi:hypothetical protein FNAPI_7792 [Fusarium napiforme]|uniref:Uncharacterized protein n=1 Tax=Fusarium napiforme TaxID=42672 RepID=A0A8H5N2Y2_9HYPO|nr:hypothetical protein FNAPI_7792 [Fusarium napiforme]
MPSISLTNNSTLHIDLAPYTTTATHTTKPTTPGYNHTLDFKPLLSRAFHKLHRRDTAPEIIGIVVGLTLLAAVIGDISTQVSKMVLKISSLSVMSDITAAMECIITPTTDITGFTTDDDIIVQALEDQNRYFRSQTPVIYIHSIHRMRWTHLRYMMD